MRTSGIVLAMCLLISSVAGAPEAYPAPVYKASTADTTNFLADQPSQSSNAGFQDSGIPIVVQTVQPTAVAPVGQTSSVSNQGSTSTSDNTQLYNTDGYSEHYNNYPGYDAGYGVQTGYEGYLVPTGGYYSPLATTGVAGPLGYLWSLIPTATAVVKIVSKGLIILVAAAAVISIGALAVFGICAFTPFCTLTLRGLNTGTIREEVRAFITPDRISSAAQFVRNAIDKYQKMQTSKVR